jgi:hypothetical protein
MVTVPETVALLAGLVRETEGGVVSPPEPEPEEPEEA